MIIVLFKSRLRDLTYVEILSSGSGTNTMLGIGHKSDFDIYPAQCSSCNLISIKLRL